MSVESTMKTRLRASGLTATAINAAWPSWWSTDAEASASAVADLKFSLARQLGLAPTSLLGDDEPRFIWVDQTRFKNLGSVTEHEAAVLASFSVSIARSALQATPPMEPGTTSLAARDLRAAILATSPVIGLPDIVGICWAHGIPVLQLEVFPLQRKRMHAVCARVEEHHAVLVGRKTQFPAQAAFWIAHELGHAALGHVGEAAALMDVEDPLSVESKDEEEVAADRYALELLTGHAEPAIEVEGGQYTATQLAHAATTTGMALGIDPGVLALCLAHAEGTWEQAMGALKILNERGGNGSDREVGHSLNTLAQQMMDFELLASDAKGFLRTVLGL